MTSGLILCCGGKGQNVHDARLVTAMLTHQSTPTLRCEADDCTGFQDMTVIQPGDVDADLTLLDENS